MMIRLPGIEENDTCSDCSKMDRECRYCNERFESLDELVTHYKNYIREENKHPNNGCCFYCDEYLFFNIERTCQTKNLRYNDAIDSYVCNKCSESYGNW
jgi:hypothetical protein